MADQESKVTESPEPTATAVAEPAAPDETADGAGSGPPLAGLSLVQIADRARRIGRPEDYFDEEAPEEVTGEEELEGMMEMYEETLASVEEGEIVHAKVIRVTDKVVILDVGFKSEGSVNRDEFKEPGTLQPGDQVEVFLERLEDDDGLVVLSKKKADFLRVWEKIREAHESEVSVPGILAKKIKGGVIVDIMGVDAFLPGSQLALRRVPNLEELIGKTYDFKIIKLNKRRRNIVVSRRVLLEAEREVKRDELKKELEVGQLRKGVVKNITDFGAFIDLGGMDGLLHITDMSWGRVGHPSEVVQIGGELEVKILDIDWERERLSLGIKQLQGYPWEGVDKKYPVGSRVLGRVVSVTNYGAFVELEKGVEGLVHISEMSWTRNVKHPSQVVNVGEEIEAVVLRVDVGEEKISLGMKQIEEDPWHAFPEKYPLGTRLNGTVRNLTSFGAFVEVEPGIDGLVHVSDMSWTKRVEHPSELLASDDELEVVILGIDPDAKRISLGIKQVTEDPWPALGEKYHADEAEEVSAKVRRFEEEGLVVDIGEEVEGFVPHAELGANLPDPSDFFEPGDELEVKPLEVDKENRRIIFTVARIPKLEEGAGVPKAKKPKKPKKKPAEPEEEPAGSAAPEQDGEPAPEQEEAEPQADGDPGEEPEPSEEQAEEAGREENRK